MRLRFISQNGEIKGINPNDKEMSSMRKQFEICEALTAV